MFYTDTLPFLKGGFSHICAATAITEILPLKIHNPQGMADFTV